MSRTISGCFTARVFALTIPALFLFVMVVPGRLSATPSISTHDYDADGLSDPMFVSIGNSGELSWSASLSASQGVQDLGDLGEVGNHLAPGFWTQSGAIELGVVSIDSANPKSILWSIRTSDQQSQEMVLGRKGDYVLAGADLNGDGVHDPLTARISARSVAFAAKVGGFQSSQVTRKKVSGLSGIRVFYLSPLGVNDWLGVVGRDSRGRYQARFVDPNSNQVVSGGRWAARLVGQSAAWPVGVKDGAGKSILMVAINSGSAVRLNFINQKGRILWQTELAKDGDITVGNFTAEAGQEVAVQDGTTYRVVNPFSRSQSTLTVPDGIAVDLININRVKAVQSGAPTPTPTQSPGNDPDCQNPIAFPTSDFIYKTIGSSHFSDVRRNTIGLIGRPGSPAPSSSCVDVLDSQRNVVAQMGMYAQNEANWRFRVYAGIGCGSDTPYNGRTIGQKAKEKTGSTNIYFDFGGRCYGPIDATKCIGSSQC